MVVFLFYAKEAFRIVYSYFRYFFRISTARCRQSIQRVEHISGIVELATVRHRGKIWRICFNENSLLRDNGGNLMKLS